MHDDEVADALELRRRLRVVARAERFEFAAEREHLDQPRHADLDEVDAGALERLEESAGEAQRDDVLVPGLAAPPGDVADQPRLEQRRTLEIREQFGARGLLGDVRAAIHQAVADAVLQRNAPLPAGAARHGARVRQDAIGGTGLHRERAIGGQPLAPVFVTGLERLLDEQAAKAGAVDEQIAFDAPAVFHDQRGDVAVPAVLLDAGDLALDALDTLGLVLRTQVARVQPGVEVVRVVDRHAVPKWRICRHRGLCARGSSRRVRRQSPRPWPAATCCGNRPSRWTCRLSPKAWM